MNANKIGQFIKDLRCEKNLTQKELAQKIACTDKAISRWETGKGMPEISYLVSLAEVFEISVDELLKGERVMEENINKDTNELVKDLVPVVNNQIKRTKKQTFREILLGTLFSLAVWILAFLVSGGYTMFDYHKLFKTSVLVLAYPLFFLAVCICLAIFSVKYKKEIFYKATMIALFIPFMAGLIILPIALCGLYEWLFVIIIVMSIYYWPLSSLQYGIIEMLENLFKLNTYETTNMFISTVIIAIPALIGLIISIIIFRKRSVVK